MPSLTLDVAFDYRQSLLRPRRFRARRREPHDHLIISFAFGHRLRRRASCCRLYRTRVRFLVFSPLAHFRSYSTYVIASRPA